MDSCCLNRPYDDLSNDVVRLESEAVLTIIDRCDRRIWDLCNSDVLYDEIDRITDVIRKEKIFALCNSSAINIELNDAVIRRAKELHRLNIKSFDALHVASAEYGKADVFLTTDKRLVNASKRIDMKVKVSNPAVWLTEVLFYE
jgi:predicted nucleic acid-binding protein